MKSLNSYLLVLVGVTPELWTLTTPFRTTEPLLIAFWGLVLLGLSSRLRESDRREAERHRAEVRLTQNRKAAERSSKNSLAQPA
jgi:hypothetical protein